MLDGIGDTGWAELTIADIVRRAHVSKRTFYEHFATKEACLLALCEREGTRLVDDLEAAIQRLPPDARRVGEGARFYLAHLAARPRVVRALTVDILQLGAEGLAVRRRVMRRFAALLQREINASGTRPPISLEVAMVLVGGINELTLEAFEAGRGDKLAELADSIIDVVGRMLSSPAPRTRRR
jgi:AcrR family transcriptional regulator